MNKTISVIIPVYNVEKYLDRCLESVVNQTYKNLEIILVDDESPDNCPQMCDAWAKKDSRIKVIHKENQGVSAARNAALDIATGDYITFVDSDDYISSDMLEALYQKSVSEDADIVECNCDYVYENGDRYEVRWYTFQSAFGTEDVLSKYFSGNFISPGPCCKLYKRAVVGNIRFPEDVQIAEDYIFNYRVLYNVNKVLRIDTGIYNYFMRENSATHLQTEEMLNRWKITKSFLPEITNEKIHHACVKRLCKDLYEQIRAVLETRDKALIDKLYLPLANEIKSLKNEFENNEDMSEYQKRAVKLIVFSPTLYKAFYRLCLMLKKLLKR